MLYPFYYLPLEKCSIGYRISKEVEYLDWKRHPDDEYIDYIENNATEERTRVQIYDAIYTTSVLVINDINGYAFVCVNNDLIPMDCVREHESKFYYIQKYFKSLAKKISFSEGMTPDQCASLSNQYIRPQFIYEPNSNESSKAIGWEEFLSFPHVLLVGEAGLGKTSCMRKIALEFIAQHNDDSIGKCGIPVYIQLRYWSNNPNLLSQVINSLRSNNGEDLVDEIEFLQQDGRLILLLDGLDETEEKNRKEICELINEFSEKYPQNKIIISSRPNIYLEQLNDFESILLDYFNAGQIKEYCYRKLYKHKSWKEYVCYLMSSKELYKLVQNPLFLSLSLFLYLKNNIVPTNKAQLSKEIIGALIENWDLSRGVERYQDKYFNSLRLKNYLGKLSYYCKVNDKYHFSIDDACRCYGNTEKKHVENVLNKIFEISGLIRKDPVNTWHFSHYSLLNFMSAIYLVEKTEGLSSVYKNHCSNKSWDAIWYNISGLSSDPDFIVNMLEKRYTKNDPRKAIDLLNFLLESVFLDKSQVTVTLQKIFSVVIDISSMLELHMNKNLISNKVPKNAIHSLCFSTRKKNISTEDLSTLSELIKLTYLCKATIYESWIKEYLSGSESKFLQTLSTLFDHVGHLETKCDNQILSIYISPESPQINDSE